MNVGVFAIGAVIFLLGIFAYVYDESGTQPFRNLTVPIVIAGVLVMVIGAVLPTIKTKTVTDSVEVPERKRRVVVHED